ncbi:MAG: glycosyltransferase [Gluconacetobacter diazotrophicus]|nr:glycosyltransferase [Gluconacetobacter diazotrophicus]
MTDTPSPEPGAAAALAIVVPALDEASTIPRLARTLAALHPAAAEIVVVDGGSRDDTVALCRRLGLRVIEHDRAGRAAQINRGVSATISPLVCVLHADTVLPDDAVAVMRRALADPRTALAGFTPLITGPDRTWWLTTAHNRLKTWYAPLLFRPKLFLRGARLLFGDHALFFRRADFEAVGGLDPSHDIMEEADLCARMAIRGRVRLLDRVVLTSDRRVAAWGQWKANRIYLSVGARWGFGLRRRLSDRYPHIR